MYINLASKNNKINKLKEWKEIKENNTNDSNFSKTSYEQLRWLHFQEKDKSENGTKDGRKMKL